MRTLRHIFAVVLAVVTLAVGSLDLKAQDEESPISFGIGLESRYVWRGYNYNGASPSLQPSFAVSLGKVEIGAWGGYQIAGQNVAQYTIDDDARVGAETDVYISFSPTDALTITVTDFFYHQEGGTGETNQYFDYNKGHWIEASVSIAPESIPFSLLAAVNVYGDKTDEDEEAYSAYVEATYSKTLKGGVDFSAFAGFAIAPENSSWYTGYTSDTYAARGVTGFVNVGVSAAKELKVNETLSIPVYSKVIFNPAQENYYLVFGLSF